MPALALSAVCTALLAGTTTLALSAGLVAAQIYPLPAPFQSVPTPPAQCPSALGCTYSERNPLTPTDGYRFQMLQTCGANCTTQYWVSNAADGKTLLTIAPIRGGGLIAIDQSNAPQDTHPPIRTIVPDYQPTDAMCCPSQYQDTTYTWDPAGSALVGSPTIIPAANFRGWESERQSLEGERIFPVFQGLVGVPGL